MTKYQQNKKLIGMRRKRIESLPVFSKFASCLVLYLTIVKGFQQNSLPSRKCNHPFKNKGPTVFGYGDRNEKDVHNMLSLQSNSEKNQRNHEEDSKIGSKRLIENNYCEEDLESSGRHDMDSMASLFTDSTHSKKQISNRRLFMQGMLFASAIPAAAVASVSEVDSTGNLYSPKSEMLSGGSAAARGFAIEQPGRKGIALKPGQALQSVYGPRFIAYLSRFLLNFDQSLRDLGEKNGLVNSDEDEIQQRPPLSKKARERKFAEFAESVEIGLADYFVGPYGSYSSVAAAKAGAFAANPTKSTQSIPTERNLLKEFFESKEKKKVNAAASTKLAKQGVLNLFALLKARYTSTAEKRQLAILFSFISNPALQPTAEIRSLMGEADNAKVSKISYSRPYGDKRKISRLGGGHGVNSTPAIYIEPPPALGNAYKPAKVKPIMKSTSRILRINLLDGGEGYTSAPQVTIQQAGYKQACQACAILDRKGRVESIFVLDPGFGYRYESNGSPPKVSISPPKTPKGNEITRQALAKAELDYEIDSIEIIDGGNGYVALEPPRILVPLPEVDPDWFLDTCEQPQIKAQKGFNKTSKEIRSKVKEMVYPDGSLAYSTEQNFLESPNTFRKESLDKIRSDPLQLLCEKPVLERDESTGALLYATPYFPQFKGGTISSPYYRAVDPIFGGVGSVPVTKGASALTGSEYGRLALSGAICTVLVRTGLNPLELIKTKQQLENDDKLFAYARERKFNQEKGSSLPEEPTNNNKNQTIITTKHSTDYPSNISCLESSPSLDKSREVVMSSSETGGIAKHVKMESTSDAPDSSTTITVPPQLAVEIVSAKSKPETKEMNVTELSTVVKEENTIDDQADVQVGTFDILSSLIELRGVGALFQSADVTFLASVVFGSFGFGANEIFRRYFTELFFTEETTGASNAGGPAVLLLAAALATVITAAAASPFELLRVRSMGLLEPKEWTEVLQDFLDEEGKKNPTATEFETSSVTDPIDNDSNKTNETENFFSGLSDFSPQEYFPLFSGFLPIVSRELPFALVKFLVFDFLAKTFIALINSQSVEGALPVQVGVGPLGLFISAFSGALAGIAGAVISHPADLILTYTTSSKSSSSSQNEQKVEDLKTSGRAEENENMGCNNMAKEEAELIHNMDDKDSDTEDDSSDWLVIVKMLLSQEGGIANLFVGLSARVTFFFLVIGLQFFLYDYGKGLLQVGTADLDLVLDVFYAVRSGLGS